MNFKTVYLKDLTINLDSKRKPLNDGERKSIKNIGMYPYCGANGILDYVDQYIFDQEILCLAEDGGSWGYNQKCTYIMNEKCWVNNHAHVLVPRENVSIKYLSYYLNFSDLNKYITGTTRGKLTKTALEKIEVKIPNYSDQLKIVNILDHVQMLINKRKNQINALTQLMQSVFLELFGDPVTNNKGWYLQKLSETGELKRGMSKHRPRNAPELLGGPYPLIQTGDVSNSGIYIKGYHQTYSELGLKQSKMWPAGTLCITIAANIAKTGILTFDACFPDSVVAYLPKNMSNIYVHFWFSFLQRIIEANAPESAQKNINLKILSDLDIPVPPIEKQKHFEAIIKDIEKQEVLLQKGLLELENSFNSILQRAFKGELFNEEKIVNL